MRSGSGEFFDHSRPKPLDDRKPENDRIFDVSSARPALLLCPDAPELTKWSTGFTETLQDTGRQCSSAPSMACSLCLLCHVGGCSARRVRGQAEAAVAATFDQSGIGPPPLVQESARHLRLTCLRVARSVPPSTLFPLKDSTTVSAAGERHGQTKPAWPDRSADTGKSGNTKISRQGPPGPQPPRPSRVPPAGEQRFAATEVLVALPSISRRRRLIRWRADITCARGIALHRPHRHHVPSLADHRPTLGRHVVRALKPTLACARRSLTTGSRCRPSSGRG